jgi:hypothetical protein
MNDTQKIYQANYVDRTPGGYQGEIQHLGTGTSENRNAFLPRKIFDDRRQKNLCFQCGSADHRLNKCTNILNTKSMLVINKTTTALEGLDTATEANSDDSNVSINMIATLKKTQRLKTKVIINGNPQKK